MLLAAVEWKGLEANAVRPRAATGRAAGRRARRDDMSAMEDIYGTIRRRFQGQLKTAASLYFGCVRCARYAVEKGESSLGSSRRTINGGASLQEATLPELPNF